MDEVEAREALAAAQAKRQAEFLVAFEKLMSEYRYSFGARVYVTDDGRITAEVIPVPIGE